MISLNFLASAFIYVLTFCVSRKGSGETTRMCRLIWAFAAHIWKSTKLSSLANMLIAYTIWVSSNSPLTNHAEIIQTFLTFIFGENCLTDWSQSLAHHVPTDSSLTSLHTPTHQSRLLWQLLSLNVTHTMLTPPHVVYFVGFLEKWLFHACMQTLKIYASLCIGTGWLRTAR